ncbi:MAG TPA: cyclic pyranopterin monophosphate synthase MoaC [Kiritimatiellae bacterium]|nr:cyclic pyranopterin monophosphate synthase MoaC [Kiritimatiellia bacterium]
MSMVDVSGKEVVFRKARARARMELPRELLARVAAGEMTGPKGPVFQTAVLAGTMAAKDTGRLIPYCHPLAIERCEIRIIPGEEALTIEAEVAAHARTGVEMEALAAVAVAALAVYDMCKGQADRIVVREIKLLEKSKSSG